MFVIIFFNQKDSVSTNEYLYFKDFKTKSQKSCVSWKKNWAKENSFWTYSIIKPNLSSRVLTEKFPESGGR